MRIAIPVWGDRVSTVFDAAEELLIIDQASKHSVRKSKIPFRETSIINKTALIRELGIDVLICGALTRPMEYMIEAAGIRVFSFVRGEADEVLEAFHRGGLANQTFIMPGCQRGMGRGQRGACRRGRQANRGGRRNRL
ncbi:MAG: NifB/NifX family molybdenum-iron cluster-binding protein [Deltaproteobacteria bacterium]|nr:NifB/NifX family molybdenum-iron cluster-binding protein [Deltaproteobacteria bacterium]